MQLPEPYHGGGYDILNAICDVGGILPRPKNYRGGEYDDKPRIFGAYLKIMSGRSLPDQVAKSLQIIGYCDGSVNDLWNKVEQAISRRVAFLAERKDQVIRSRQARQALSDPAPF